MVKCVINGCDRFSRFPRNKTICEELRKLCEKCRKIDFKNACVCSKYFVHDYKIIGSKA